MRVTATHLGVHVVDVGGGRNAQATAMIRQKHLITLAMLERAITFQPDLRVLLHGRDLRRDSIIAIRFQITQNDRLKWVGHQPQPYHGDQDDFLPNRHLLDLTRLRTTWIGDWELRVGVTGFGSDQITGQDPADVKLFIENLPYAELTKFRWQVASRIEALITSTGEFTRSVNPQVLQAVEVPLDQI